MVLTHEADRLALLLCKAEASRPRFVGMWSFGPSLERHVSDRLEVFKGNAVHGITEVCITKF